MVIFHSYVSLPEGNVGKAMPFLPSILGMVNIDVYTTYKNGDDLGDGLFMALFCPRQPKMAQLCRLVTYESFSRLFLK